MTISSITFLILTEYFLQRGETVIPARLEKTAHIDKDSTADEEESEKVITPTGMIKMRNGTKNTK